MLKEKAGYILNISNSKCLTPKIQGWPESLFGFCPQGVMLRMNFLANQYLKNIFPQLFKLKKKTRNLKDMPEKMNELQVNVGSILEELKKKDYKERRIVLIVSTNFSVSLKDYSTEVCFPTWEKEIFTPTPALHTEGSSTFKLS